MDILNTPAQPVDGRPGTTDTAILVRMPKGHVIPVGVQVGKLAADYVATYSIDGARVVGVRRGEVTIDFVAQQREARRKAMALVYLCQTNGIWTDRLARKPDLVMAERVMSEHPMLAGGIYEQVDQLIAAYEGQG